MASVWTIVLANDLASQLSARTILDAASIADPGHAVTQVRVKFQAHSVQDSIIDGASIGLRSGATEDYQVGKFVRLLFSSSNGVTIPGGGTVWSDWVNFSDFDPDIDHLVHVDMGNSYSRYAFTGGEGAYYKVGDLDDCMVQDISSYTFASIRSYFAIELEVNDISTTVAPTTVAPTTLAPTTLAPTTLAPTSLAPTTTAPTTLFQTTMGPTTKAPSTGPATTVPPTTFAPSTGPATTVPPTTEPFTTSIPTTVAPTTVAPTTLQPTTLAPTTVAPTTTEPTTLAPTTQIPTTLAPTTLIPTTLGPTVPPTTNIPEAICTKELNSTITNEIPLRSLITKEIRFNGHLC